MRRILILGAGTGGTLAANRLRLAFPADEVEVLVVDRDDRHIYQPGLLFVPFGLARPDGLVRSERLHPAGGRHHHRGRVLREGRRGPDHLHLSNSRRRRNVRDDHGRIPGGSSPARIGWERGLPQRAASDRGIRMVVDAGGYDPDPFEPLAFAGCLRQVLHDGGATRVVQGERAGSWISDQMALTTQGEIVPRVLEMIGAVPPATL